MAQGKRQDEYPVRVELPGAVRRAQPQGARGAGASVNRTVRESASRALSDVARSIPVFGPAIPVLASKPARVATRDFVEGALTGEAEVQPRRQTVQASGPSLRDVFVNRPVKTAQAAGKYIAAVDKTNITPEQYASAVAATILSRPTTTLNQATQASGLIPARGTPQTAKDSLYGGYRNAAEAIYAQQIAQATKLAETDQEAAVALQESATKEFLRNLGAVLQGGLPAGLTIADAIEQDPG